MIWKRLFYFSASLTFIVLALAVFLNVTATSPGTKDAFEPTGNTSHDVLLALVDTGRLEAMPSDARTTPARQAITLAERDLGLPADGIPDQGLLDRLVARIEAGGQETATVGWALNDMLTLVTIIGAIVTTMLKVLTHYRDPAKA